MEVKLLPPIRLTQAAWLVVSKYFTVHQDERLKERRTHYIDPLINPDAFFESELGEPIHHTLLMLVRSNRSVFDQNHAHRWILEEKMEEGDGVGHGVGH